MRFENAVNQHPLKKLYHGFEKTGSDKLTSLYVVDACVVVKWLLPDEPYDENADRLRQGCIVCKSKNVCPFLHGAGSDKSLVESDKTKKNNQRRRSRTL